METPTVNDSPDGQPVLCHLVFFTLTDNSPTAVAKLVEACNKYLSDHPGTVRFDVGTRILDLQRPVNDQEFDVSLQIVFQTRADHDRYQKSEKHVTFIEENKGNWKQSRVFDSYKT